MNNLFKGLFKKKEKKSPKIYWTGGCFGDYIGWTDTNNLEVYGFKDIRPEVGDRLYSKMQSGKWGVFEFIEVRCCIDPGDMFFGKLKFIGYMREENGLQN